MSGSPVVGPGLQTGTADHAEERRGRRPRFTLLPDGHASGNLVR